MHIATETRRIPFDTLTRRYASSIPFKIALSLAFVVLTGLLAQIRLPLPFTPVPVTGQTLAVLLAGVLLGRKWAGVSMGIYGVLGMAGVPWFSGGVAGLGATTGYLAGFILAAMFVGFVAEGGLKIRSYYGWLAVMLFSALILVYVPGALWLGGWLGLVLHQPVTLGMVFGLGVAPFMAGCILKAVLAAGAARLIRPQ